MQFDVCASALYSFQILPLASERLLQSSFCGPALFLPRKTIRSLDHACLQATLVKTSNIPQDTIQTQTPPIYGVSILCGTAYTP
jgi:hypothetical protein